MTRLLSESQKAALWPTVEGQDSKRLLAALYGTARSKEPLEQLLAVFQKTWLVEDLLMKADEMSNGDFARNQNPFSGLSSRRMGESDAQISEDKADELAQI